MKIYSKSDIGLVRETNQDDLYYKVISDDIAWAVVCDGMGGARGGDVASSTAIDVIKECLTQNIHDKITESVIPEIILDSINKANKKICSVSSKDFELQGMGTTVVIALIYRGILHVAHLGDSRAYILNDTVVKQVTVDHSIVQEMVDKGEITLKQAETHPRKNIITKALGIGLDINADYSKILLGKNDSVLICTDGLTNYVSSNELYNAFIKYKSEDVVESLTQMANNRGGRDNITVVAIIR